MHYADIQVVLSLFEAERDVLQGVDHQYLHWVESHTFRRLQPKVCQQLGYYPDKFVDQHVVQMQLSRLASGAALAKNAAAFTVTNLAADELNFLASIVGATIPLWGLCCSGTTICSCRQYLSGDFSTNCILVCNGIFSTIHQDFLIAAGPTSLTGRLSFLHYCLKI